MSATEPSRRRNKPVRLKDVPLPVRRRAARAAVRYEDDLLEKWRIIMLAEDPGDLVAWVAP